MLQIKLLQRLEASSLLSQRVCSCEAWSAPPPLRLTLASERPARLPATALKAAARSVSFISSRSMRNLSAIETTKTASLKPMILKPIQSLLSIQRRITSGASSQSGSRHGFSVRFASEGDSPSFSFPTSESPQPQETPSELQSRLQGFHGAASKRPAPLDHREGRPRHLLQ